VLFWHLYWFYFFKCYEKSDLPYFISRLEQYDVGSIPLDVSYFTTGSLHSARLFELANGRKTKWISAWQSNSV